MLTAANGARPAPAVDRPIFVVGTGRSGSSAFYEVLARHPEVAWLSSLTRDFPGWPRLNQLLMRATGNPVGARLFAGWPRPAEAYRFWERNCPGFANPCRDLVRDDATPESARRLLRACAGTTTRRRSRFLAKFTGWPRLRFLSAIFPDALFVEVTRDAAATAASLLEVPFWDGWRGPPSWRRGALPGDLDCLWRQENRSFVALAAIECALLARAMTECRAEVDAARIMSVDYDELCADASGVFTRVAAFCGLGWPARFADAVSRSRFVNRNDAWRSRLSTAQQAVLLRTLERAGVSAGRSA